MACFVDDLCSHVCSPCMFSALNLVWCDLDLNVEATPNIASVFTDRRLWIQPSRGYRRGVFYTGTTGERKKGRKSGFWVHWTSPKFNVAVQADFSLFLSLVNLLAVLKCSWGLVWESITSKHKSCMTNEWATLGLSVLSDRWKALFRFRCFLSAALMEPWSPPSTGLCVLWSKEGRKWCFKQGVCVLTGVLGTQWKELMFWVWNTIFKGKCLLRRKYVKIILLIPIL